MLEIFALPYILATGLIGWSIFEPFFRIDESQPLSPARLTISDLLACPLPIGILFALARLLTPMGNLPLTVKMLVLAVAMVFAATALLAGLYLIPKTFQVTFLKRVTVVGIIAPFGIVLTVGWIGFLIWVCFYSVIYLAPALIAIAALTLGLRRLTLWVCQAKSNLV